VTQATISGRTVLLVEDDDELRGVLGRGLREEGFAVDFAANGAIALERVDQAVPDVLVIDIGLPDADGRDLCQALRARGIQTPVLFLTARDAVVDRISGFDAGGDDYLSKPFAFVELVARLQALMRRGGVDGVLESGGLTLDPLTHSLSDGSLEVPLTPTEFRLLARLFAGPGEAIRRRDLVRAGWPHGAIVRENTLDSYVARLRRKLKQFERAPEISTVHAVGYRLGS
jgi:two-component system response regulator MprA